MSHDICSENTGKVCRMISNAFYDPPGVHIILCFPKCGQEILIKSRCHMLEKLLYA